jgi:serine/threonine protein phosphatase PrpC
MFSFDPLEIFECQFMKSTFAEVIDTKTNTSSVVHIRDSYRGSLLIKCTGGEYLGKFHFLGNVCLLFTSSSNIQNETIGSSREEGLVSLSISCDSIRSVHCRIHLDSVSGMYQLLDLSESKPGVWVKLRHDRGIPVDSKTALEHERMIYESCTSLNGVVEGFKEYPVSLLSFRPGTSEGVRYVFSKSPGVSSGGDIWIRLSPLLAHELHPNDQFRLGRESENTIVFEVHRFSVGSGCAQGIRPTMEDEEVAIDDLPIPHYPDLCVSWYGCYDGHGSHECSEYLQKNLHKVFQSNFPHSLNVVEIARSLVQTFVSADDKFSAYAKQRGISPNVGAVVVVVVIIANSIFCANLGDARAILSRNDGSVVGLSQDFKPNLPSESDRIKKCGGQVINNRVNGRLAVSRAIGDMEFKPSGIVSNIPEIRYVEMQPNDEFILLACDGLFDVMTSDEVAEFVRAKVTASVARNQEPNPRQIAVDLVTESIMKRNTTDNVTVMIIFLKKYCTN